ncbi:MAG: DotA/TraY family protein [Pseudobdellovibrionaceae bacterium]|jgi:conjugal transfer/type IV secretion protein DotA/TraY|nr:DotA/TraY family protein [Pseudobdellovibrionaceae bacterium]
MAVSRQQTVSVAKYVLFPQILPRIVDLFFTGFAYFAYFVAQVYSGVRLLPSGHPYLKAHNIGRYNILDVVVQAGRGLKYRRENIDQIILFYVILLGLFLMVIQGAMMLFSVVPQAMAAVSLSYFFGTPGYSAYQNGEQDLAFILLDRVFGIPDLFNSCVSVAAATCFRSSGSLLNSGSVYTPGAFPWPFHEALHALFEFYSIGLLVIASFILLYFVVVIIAETAQTGVPFGKRFNTVWAPLRLIVGIGLLVPVGFGMNSAQFIVLYAAKYGSNFATNGWMVFNTKLSSGHMVEGMVAKPQKPDANGLLKFMMLAHACKAIEEGYMEFNTQPLSGGGGTCATAVGAADEEKTIINAYLVRSGDPSTNSMLMEDTDYLGTLGFFDNTSFTIRFGDRGCTSEYSTQLGYVKPICGELVLPQNALESPGAVAMQEGYYELVRHLWGKYNNKVWPHWGFCTDSGVSNVIDSSGDEDFKIHSLYYVQKLCPVDKKNLTAAKHMEPDTEWINAVLADYFTGDVCSDPGYASGSPGLVPPTGATGAIAASVMENIVREALYAEIDDISSKNTGKYIITDDLLARGWAGAGLWYNHIAQSNGALVGSVWKAPQVSKWPQIQRSVLSQKKMNDQNITVGGANSTGMSGTASLKTGRGEQEVIAAGKLYQIDMAWSGASISMKPKSGNISFDFLNWLFGTQGLFDLKDPVNQTTHPLALMTALGKSLVEASIRNLALALTGQVAQMFDSEVIGPFAEGASSLLYTAATITLTAGFILYYVLPFLPFVYFFFAVGNWVKGIFEAMVGVPLWALAHIRIDGDGLPGSAALNGYFLIFEIFLRPILIVFGLIAAVSIFAAMAIVFNSIFDLAVYNVGGVNMTGVACGTPEASTILDMVRGPLDQFFYTIMYAVVIYIMALSSFKLIDLIPNKILRWMGASVDTFGDMAGDPAQNLTNYAAIGGSQMTQGMIGSLRGGVGALGKGVEGIKKMGDG